MSKGNKNNHVIKAYVYTGYIRSKTCPIKMPEKMIEDLQYIAKSRGTNLSEMVRQDLLDKYYFELIELNKGEPIIWHGNIEDMPEKAEEIK